MNQTNQRILLTGAAGFIGWKTTEKLLEQGHEVIGIDNMNDYYDVRLKEWRLEQLTRVHSQKNSGTFAFHKLDIENYNSLHDVFNKYSLNKPNKQDKPNKPYKPDKPNKQDKPNKPNKPDKLEKPEKPFNAVINLAARAGVRYSMENPFVYYTTNVIGNLNLLELCREFGIKKYVLASTSSLYACQKMPFTEDLAVNEPISPYAASKKSGEVTCYTYHKLYNLDVTILRYFTVYGPAGRPDMSVFRFIAWIDQEKPVTIYGDGNQSRDFTYVDDIALGTIAALKPLGFEIINLGNNNPHKLMDVLHIIEEKLNKPNKPNKLDEPNKLDKLDKQDKPNKLNKPKILYEPFHPADMLATWADITKAKKLLGWQPQVGIDQGIESTIKWYEENRQWVKTIKF